MCGIGAFQIVNNEVDPAKVARVLLRLLQVRGTDASGVAWHASGETYICKDNCAGKELARKLPNGIGTTGIVHTRWATQGDPADNNNNHPIDVGGLVGVHNGHISNDKEVLSMLPDYKRAGKVDSEAAFAMLAHAPAGTTLGERISALRGTMAFLWLESYDQTETLHAARVSSSPLWVAQTVAGSVLFASTADILKETAKRCEMQIEFMQALSEGTYLKVRHGMIAEMREIPTPPKPVYQTSYKMPDYSHASVYSSSSRRNDPTLF